MFKRFIGFLAALMSLAVFVACGNNTELDEVDFMSIRDVELGLTFSLGMTGDEVIDLLQQAGFEATHRPPLSDTAFPEIMAELSSEPYRSLLRFGMRDNVVAQIIATSHINSERFIAYDHEIGEHRDGYVIRFYDMQGEMVDSSSTFSLESYVSQRILIVGIYHIWVSVTLHDR